MHICETLNFSIHIKGKTYKAIKGIGIIKKPKKTLLLQHSLVTIYKSVVSSHLEYSDIICEQTNNERFIQKIEKIQYSAALAIAGVVKGTSQDKLTSRLGFEFLKCSSCLKTALFQKLRQIAHQNTYLRLFHKPTISTILACQKVLQHFTADVMFSSTSFSNLQYWIDIFYFQSTIYSAGLLQIGHKLKKWQWRHDFVT